MVGPAGSIREGDFSCANDCEEDEVCSPPEDLAGVLADWARATDGARTANKQENATERTVEDRNAMNVMKNPKYNTRRIGRVKR
jgi:hypothetical protein